MLDKNIKQERTIPRPYLARAYIPLFQQLAHEGFYLAVLRCFPRFIDEMAGTRVNRFTTMNSPVD
jgi:hypothetical protein